MLRVGDIRAILDLLGDCRDLGDDRVAWRVRLAEGVAALTDSDMVLNGEMGGCQRLALRDLGVTFWWRHDFINPTVIADYLREFRVNPLLSPAMNRYHACNRGQDGLALARSDFIEDRDWYRSEDYHGINRPYGVDQMMGCFRQIEGAVPGENSGFVVLRAHGRRDFAPRDRTLVRELHRAPTPLIGGRLARFADPSPADLPPRARAVLAALLEGDGDKQVAVRLGLSRYTVNESTKRIYRHFGVRGRSELLARWIRLGWGASPGWSRESAHEERPTGRSYSLPG